MRSTFVRVILKRWMRVLVCRQNSTAKTWNPAKILWLESLRYSLSPYYHVFPSWFRRLWMNKLYGIILCCKHQPCTFWWIDEKNLFLLFKAYNLLLEGYVITLLSSFMKIFFSATLKEKNTHQEKWMENKFKWFYCLADSQ